MILETAQITHRNETYYPVRAAVLASGVKDTKAQLRRIHRTFITKPGVMVRIHPFGDCFTEYGLYLWAASLQTSANAVSRYRCKELLAHKVVDLLQENKELRARIQHLEASEE